MNFGKALKDTRKMLELRQTAVAEAVGISQTYLSQIEGETKIPSLEVIEKLRLHYDVPPTILSWLATESDEIKPEFKHLYPPIDTAVRDLIREFFKSKK